MPAVHLTNASVAGMIQRLSSVALVHAVEVVAPALQLTPPEAQAVAAACTQDTRVSTRLIQVPSAAHPRSHTSSDQNSPDSRHTARDSQAYVPSDVLSERTRCYPHRPPGTLFEETADGVTCAYYVAYKGDTPYTIAQAQSMDVLCLLLDNNARNADGDVAWAVCAPMHCACAHAMGVHMRAAS